MPRLSCRRYPVGNFKMAVRHGGEGNAKDVIERRKRWLNSITIGRRQVDDEELAAIGAGTVAGPPVRLPDIDEVKRKASRSPRADSPGNATFGSTVLGPAHNFIATHLHTPNGMRPSPPEGGSKGHHRVRAPAETFDGEPYKMGMGATPDGQDAST
jgi:hypothetical protein